MQGKLFAAALLAASFAGGAAAQMVPSGMGILQAAAAVLLGGNDVIQFTGNKSISINDSSAPSDSWLFGQTSISGTTGSSAPSGYVSPYNLFISSDSVDTTTSGNGSLNGFTVYHKLTSGYTGGRSAFLSKLYVSAPAGANADYQSASFLASANSNLGGTGGAITNYSGAIFATNPNLFLLSGATNLQNAVVQELDIAIPAGANVANKYGMTITQTAADAMRGDFDDAALTFTNQTGASATWLRGISFGTYSGRWTFGADSTLIGAQTRQAGGTTNPIALWGVDFSAVTFQAGGGFLKSNDFSVDPSGNVTGAAYKVGSTSGVSCSGSPTSSFASSNGIVTHC